jgi:hypothetical protein
MWFVHGPTPSGCIFQQQASSNAEQAQASHEEFYDDHWSAAKMGGELGPTRRAILFMKTKNYEDKGRIKSAHICSDESCISLILQIYKIHNSWTCLPPSSASMLKEKSNFRDCVVC